MEKEDQLLTAKFVRARLALAQRLLEESDNLPGYTGYPNGSSNGKVDFHVHQRHEREALVMYLLLTCFDRLGQTRRFLTFHDWLQSKKSEHVTEREAVLQSNPDLGRLDAARELQRAYTVAYGMKNAFYHGINSLPPSAHAHLLSTVSVIRLHPDASRFPDRSLPPTPISDQSEEERLKMKYIFGKRNAFTHELAQQHFSSIPAMSALGRNYQATAVEGASWPVMIHGTSVQYGGSHQEQQSKYAFSISDWPFALFEVLYAVIGEAFDRKIGRAHV